jgi:hypothetical protein
MPEIVTDLDIIEVSVLPHLGVGEMEHSKNMINFSKNQ